MAISIHKTNLKEFPNGHVIDSEVFLVKSLQTAQTSKGDDYYNCVLANKLGVATLKIWDITTKLSEGDFIELYARCNIHPKYGPQWKVKQYYKSSYAGDADFNRLVYKPDADKLFNEMASYPYNNYTVEKLLEGLLKDVDSVGKFKTIPASLANHHSYAGGLIQHTYEVWSMTGCILDTIDGYNCYPEIQKDVALFGALVHDISKVEEYFWDAPEKKYNRSNASILIGNPAGGLVCLGNWLVQLSSEKLDSRVLDLIRHIFISHQMKPEWGSPVTPRCLEALAVATADGMSANVSHIAMGLEQDKTPNESFTSPYYFYMGNASIWKVPSFDPDCGRPSVSSSSASIPTKTSSIKKGKNLMPKESKEIEIAPAGKEKQAVDTTKKKGLIT